MAGITASFAEHALPDPAVFGRIDPQVAARALGGPEDFADLRLYHRVPRIIEALLTQLRVPPLRLSRRIIRGASRWIDNRRLSANRLLERLFAAAVARALALPAGEELVIAHDSSEIDKHGRGVPDDAGPLRSSNARGYRMHLAVGVTSAGEQLGALDAWAWTRSWKLRKHVHPWRPKSEKESSKWSRGIDRVERRLKQLGFRGKVVHVEDREADDYEHLAEQHYKKRRVIVRHDVEGRPRQVLAKSRGNRMLGRRNGPGQAERWITLTQKLAALPFSDSFQVEVDSRVTDRARGITHQVRTATLSLRYCNVVMKPPKRYRGRHFREGLPVGIVEVKERKPPPQAKPLHWVLIALDPIENEEEARAVIDRYKLRWKVEDYIKVAKSGCKLEAQHVDSLASFQRLMAVVLATANQLVKLVAAARTAPKLPAQSVVDPSTLSAIRDAANYHEIAWPRSRVTISKLLLIVAQVGGYELRKDRDPGWLVMTRGWTRIEEHRAIVSHERLRRARRRRERTARTL